MHMHMHAHMHMHMIMHAHMHMHIFSHFAQFSAAAHPMLKFFNAELCLPLDQQGLSLWINKALLWKVQKESQRFSVLPILQKEIPLMMLHGKLQAINV